MQYSISLVLVALMFAGGLTNILASPREFGPIKGTVRNILFHGGWILMAVAALLIISLE